MSTPLPALVVPALLWLGLTAAACTGRAAVNPAADPDPMPPRPPAADQTVYTDAELGFRISHPEGFTVRRQDVSRLARFTPVPLASIFFMNPTMAAGGLAGIEPPDLELRVYPAEGSASLESWLLAVRLATEESLAIARPLEVAGEPGLQVCSATMAAPGCPTFLLHRDRVIQLTPASREGEAMIETFALLPPR